MKSVKRPRDPIQLAKLVGDIATGQAVESASARKNPAAVALGSKGGKTRMSNLSKEQRVALAKKGAEARTSARATARAEVEALPAPKRKLKVSV